VADRAAAIVVAVLTAGSLGAAAQLRARAPGPPDGGRPPPEAAAGAFVGSDACVACHPGEHASWRASYHRTMTQVADRASVLAPFDGETLEDGERALRARRDGERFVVDELGVDGHVSASHRVELTTGSHHLQVYWTRDAEGRLTQLPFAWRVGEARWIPNAASFLVDPDLAAHGGGGRWDGACHRCHATGWSEDDPALTDADRVAVRDLGIACEACHGPAEHHVARNRDPLRRWALWLGGSDDPTIVHPARLDADRATATCAQCHSESLPRPDPDGGPAAPFLAGRRHEASFLPDAPANLHRALHARGVLSGPRVADAFWPDGTGRVAGREHTALRRSACAVEGELACTGCHTMHGDDPDAQLRPEARSDTMCTRCHAEVAAEGDEHTRHATGSEAARCVSCHMPRVTWGLFEARRTHRIDVPTASGAGSHDRPNACNLCHLDRTLAWTATALDTRGDAAPVAIDLPEAHRTRAAGVVWALTGDAVQRAIVTWHLGDPAARATSGTDWMPPLLAHLTDDRYPIVRALAGRALFGPWTGPDGFDEVAPVEVRRAHAARALAAWPGATPRPDGGRLLLRPDGSLDAATFAELAAQRDDTPVGVTE
jgi:predicted CXXCH cytochrome family protein